MYHLFTVSMLILILSPAAPDRRHRRENTHRSTLEKFAVAATSRCQMCPKLLVLQPSPPTRQIGTMQDQSLPHCSTKELMAYPPGKSSYRLHLRNILRTSVSQAEPRSLRLSPILHSLLGLDLECTLAPFTRSSSSQTLASRSPTIPNAISPCIRLRVNPGFLVRRPRVWQPSQTLPTRTATRSSDAYRRHHQACPRLRPAPTPFRPSTLTACAILPRYALVFNFESVDSSRDNLSPAPLCDPCILRLCLRLSRA